MPLHFPHKVALVQRIMTTLTIELDRGQGWEVRAEGQIPADTSLDRIPADRPSGDRSRQMARGVLTRHNRTDAGFSTTRAEVLHAITGLMLAFPRPVPRCGCAVTGQCSLGVLTHARLLRRMSAYAGQRGR